MTIVEYLKGVVGYDVPKNAIDAILLNRDIEEKAEAQELSLRLRELCTADLLIWCASTPSKRSMVKDSHGNWSHSDGGWETLASDKKALRQRANEIYSKYGEGKVDVGNKLSVCKL